MGKGKPLKKTEVRDGFMQTGTPKMLCCKHRSCLSGLSVDQFQDLPIPFRQVVKGRNFKIDR